jgi:hypothetical protein
MNPNPVNKHQKKSASGRYSSRGSSVTLFFALGSGRVGRGSRGWLVVTRRGRIPLGRRRVALRWRGVPLRVSMWRRLVIRRVWIVRGWVWIRVRRLRGCCGGRHVDVDHLGLRLFLLFFLHRKKLHESFTNCGALTNYDDGRCLGLRR